MACSMELLNFIEECEAPAPTLCFDIMELVGKQVDIIRQTKENKKNYGECVNTLNTIYQGGDLWNKWVDDFEMCDDWLGFIADNYMIGYGCPCWATMEEAPEVFVRRFFTDNR